MRRTVKMRMICHVVAAIWAMAATASADAETKLSDGDFESPSAERSWPLPKAWSIESGVGRNGSRAAVWDNADSTHYAYPSQKLSVEPGTRFRFGGWMKVERGDPNVLGHGIQIDWSDAKGNWMSAAPACPVVDNDPNTGGWSRYEGVVTFPDGAVTARFLFFVPKGGTGRVLFDDMWLEPVSVEPLVYLQCGAYRNTFTAADGDIRFAAMLRLNLVRNRLTDYACEAVYTAATGKTVELAVTDFDAGRAQFAVPAADFAVGRQDVILRLRLKGRVVAEARRSVTRTEEPIGRRIAVDRSNRVLIDGKRFFPIGLYTSCGLMRTQAEFDVWAQAPLNFTTVYGGVDRELLDRFARSGTYVCADVRNLICGYNSAAVSEFKDFGESRVAIAKKVKEFASHPYFFGWYLMDELPLEQIPFVTAANELLRELDPDHPTYAVTDKPGLIREMMPAFDAVGMDPYPVGGWKRDLTISSGWAEQCREAMFDFRPMWHVPQMFSWRWYSEKGVTDCKSTSRLPTRREMANMTWQGIAAGANGICGYSFGAMRLHGTKAEREKFWLDVCRVLGEVKEMERVLLADDRALPVRNLPKKLVARAYRLDGADYLLVANRTAESVEATLDLPKGAYASLATLCGEGIYLDGDRLVVIFDGLGYALLRLDI